MADEGLPPALLPGHALGASRRVCVSMSVHVLAQIAARRACPPPQHDLSRVELSRRATRSLANGPRLKPATEGLAGGSAL